MATNEEGKYIWGEWLPKALQNGSAKCIPKPVVVGKGLDQLQGAIDRYVAGASGEKIVVELA